MIESFYDDLAPYYDLLHADWEASIHRQANILDGVIREFLGDQATRILDAACGIGTQSLGLAALGYQVVGSDISAGEIERARQEASKRGLSINFRVADMRDLGDHALYDVVMACDNAIPHLLSDSDILQAFHEFYRCTTNGGLCFFSVRDYANMERPERGKQFYPRRIQATDKGQIVLFDVWDFEGDSYTLTIYLIDDQGGSSAQTRIIRGGRYYWITLDRLENLFKQTGFTEVQILRDRFFQPLIIGRKMISHATF